MKKLIYSYQKTQDNIVLSFCHCGKLKVECEVPPFSLLDFLLVM